MFQLRNRAIFHIQSRSIGLRMITKLVVETERYQLLRMEPRELRKEVKNRKKREGSVSVCLNCCSFLVSYYQALILPDVLGFHCRCLG